MKMTFTERCKFYDLLVEFEAVTASEIAVVKNDDAKDALLERYEDIRNALKELSLLNPYLEIDYTK